MIESIDIGRLERIYLEMGWSTSCIDKVVFNPEPSLRELIVKIAKEGWYAENIPWEEIIYRLDAELDNEL